MKTDFRQFIGGEWTGAANGGSWELINPANEEVIDLLPYGDGADAVAALNAASAAVPAWSETTPYQRAAILERTAGLIKSRAGEFAEITTAESGKPLDQAKGEWLSAPNYFLWAAEEA
jgi:succinate-semialdehyde dehydrogenase/glutarate-semialdehyde dehydrogenase